MGNPSGSNVDALNVGVTRRLVVSLLGTANFRFGDVPFAFRAPPRALPMLAYIILQNGRPIAREQLATLFWPDDDPELGLSNVRRHAHRIQRSLPSHDSSSYLVVNRKTIAWNRDTQALVDVHEFERLLGDPLKKEQALSYYRGDLLSGYDEDWIQPERERLRSVWLDTIMELAQAAKASGNQTRWRDLAELALTADEWREEALRHVMSAYYELGDRSKALAVYQRFEERLRSEMHVDLMPETRALREVILANGPLPQMPRPHETISSNQFPQGPFVGRDSPMTELRRLWARAGRRHGSTVFISGEAGVGKSRLCREFASLVQSEGGRVLSGETAQNERGPYHALVDALRPSLPYAQLCESDDVWLSNLLPFLPELATLRPGLVATPSILDTSEPAVLFEAFARLIANLAGSRALLIVLEDVHWASASTLAAIEAIARRIGVLRVMLVATARSREETDAEPVRRMRMQLQQEHRASHLALTRLTLEETAALCNAVSGVHTDSDLAVRTYSVSQGNPLFAIQLLRSYVETGELPVTVEHGEGVAQAILTSINRLDPPSRSVLDVAATIGDYFSIDTVAAVTGWTEGEVVLEIANLIDRQLVRESAVPGLEYAFSHNLIARTAYSQTEQTTRAVRHARIAMALERSRRGDASMLSTVADHWSRGGNAAKARAAFLEAARHALRSHARAEALELAEKVLALEPDAKEEFEALKTVVAAADRSGKAEAAAAALARLERLSECLSLDERYEALVMRVRFAESRGENVVRLAAGERLLAFARENNRRDWEIAALTLLISHNTAITIASEYVREIGDGHDITDPKQRVRFYDAMVFFLLRSGRLQEARRCQDEFRAYLASHPSIDGESVFARLETRIAFFAEDRDLLKQTTLRAIDLATRRGDLLSEAEGRTDLMYLEFRSGDMESCRAQYEQATDLFSQCGNLSGALMTKVNFAVCQRFAGHVAYAKELFRDVLNSAVPGQSIAHIIIGNGSLAEIELYEANPVEALRFLDHASQDLSAYPEPKLMAETIAIRGHAEAMIGDLESGLAHLFEAMRLTRDMRQPYALATMLARFIDVSLSAGRLSGCISEALELEALIEDDLAHHEYPGWLCYSLANVASARGDREKSRAYLERGRDAVEARLSRLSDVKDREAFASMRPNDELLRFALVGRRRTSA